MLACARLGAIHSVVFGGFAAVSLASRIEDAQPKVIVSADAGSRGGRVVPYKPLLDEALGLSAHKPQAVLLVNRGLAKMDLRAGATTCGVICAPAIWMPRCLVPGCNPPTPAISSIPVARPASPRVSSAIRAVIPWPWPPACRIFSAPNQGKPFSAPAILAGRIQDPSATPLGLMNEGGVLG